MCSTSNGDIRHSLSREFVVYFSPVIIRSGTTQRVVAGFMSLWLSGFVFLFCCEDMRAAEMDAASCPLMKASSHCDHASKQANTGDSMVGTKPACVECCAFLPVVFDKSRKVDPVQKQIVVPQTAVAAIKFSYPESRPGVPPASSLAGRVPDRHGTFLKNCVFRI